MLNNGHTYFVLSALIATPLNPNHGFIFMAIKWHPSAAGLYGLFTNDFPVFLFKIYCLEKAFWRTSKSELISKKEILTSQSRRDDTR